MIPAILVKGVAEQIREATKLYKMQAEGQEDKKVSVYEQHIPDDEFRDDSYYPLVVVSCQNVEDTAEGSTATIGLTIGVYGQDKDSWLDLMSIMERIRQRLLLVQKIDDIFRLILPTKFETIENQPYPYWFGYGTLVYQIPEPNARVALELNAIMEEDN